MVVFLFGGSLYLIKSNSLFSPNVTAQKTIRCNVYNSYSYYPQSFRHQHQPFVMRKYAHEANGRQCATETTRYSKSPDKDNAIAVCAIVSRELPQYTYSQQLNRHRTLLLLLMSLFC